MFHSARLKLTLWYVLISMVISILFSLAMYHGLSLEVARSLRTQQFRLEHSQGAIFPHPPELDPSVFEEASNRIKLTLIVVNLAILGISGVAGYFLAGRTLRPIKQMVDEQNRFITDASHELRTPLTSLMTSIEVNLRNKKLNLQNAKNLLQSNLEQTYSLRALSDDLLSLSQYQTKNGNTKFEQINLEKIVEEAIKRVIPLASKKYIKILDNTKDFIFEGDQKGLTDVLVILLDNAIKYSPQNSSIQILSRISDHSVLVSVKDQGMGISEEDLPHIFDRFYRADKSRTKQQISGYGLGLSIAKKIINLHKGEISLESKIGKGTEFTIQIPKKQSTVTSVLRF